MIIQSMWIGDTMSRMERACIKSWIDRGYEYHIFIYREVENLPDGVKKLDANDVIKREDIFTYNLPHHRGGNSYSAFSNLFRYKLLIDGGIWVDTDMYCRNRLPDLEIILVEEGQSVASCIMKIPSEMAKYCYNICLSKDTSSLKWGETGPQLVTEAVEYFELNEFVQNRSKYFPIMHWEIDRFFEDIDIEDTYTVHFWNEIWRRRGIDKNAIYGQNSYYERLVDI